MDRSRPTLTDDDRRRFARHRVLREVGECGQARLRAASVALVGAGGLGSPAALYLTASGVGRIGLIDFDRVALANLQRQVLFVTADVDRAKTDAAAERLHALDPAVRIDRHERRLAQDNAVELLGPYDVVIDGSDNFAARYAVNDACLALGRPFVHGSVYRFEGRVGVFGGEGPCYRCMYPHPPGPGEAPDCSEAGVLGVVPGVIGTLQATEAIKLLLDIGEPLLGRLLVFDALAGEFREIRVPRDPRCPACGDDRAAVAPVQADASACAAVADPPGRAEDDTDRPGDLDVRALHERLARGDAPVLLDVRTEFEWDLGRLPNATWIPMDQLPERIGELDPSRETVVYCHVGGRSAVVCRFLEQRGFRRVRNLLGGIDAWSRQVDRSVPRY